MLGVTSCICVLDVMYLCVRGIGFASFYDLSIGFWNCSGNVVFLVFILLNTLHDSISMQVVPKNPLEDFIKTLLYMPCLCILLNTYACT